MRQTGSRLQVIASFFVIGLFALNAHATTPPFKKVFVMIFENASYAQAMAQPYFAQLARQGASLDNFHAETHPSQPNYIALVSGSTYNVINDLSVNVDAQHLGDLIEAKGKTWKTYAEDYPGNCFQGSFQGKYARKHVPFISFTNVQKDAARCNRTIVDASQLWTDVMNGTLPDFALYVPNLNNDGHDTGAAYADKWLQKTFSPLLNDSKFMTDTLFIATFDENDGSSGNQIYTILYGNGVNVGTKSATHYTHYDLLRTTEEILGVGTLGQQDAKAAVIEGVWN